MPAAIVRIVPEKVVKKVWGEERWITNTELYCAKRLILQPGCGCSKHYHNQKDETFIILSGSCRLELGKDYQHQVVHTMIADTSYRIHPGVVHRFTNPFKSVCVILEVSTHHDEADVVRLSESYSGKPDGPD